MTPIATDRTGLIGTARGRPGKDPIFALNAEAARRREAGESVLNATLGALLLDDGTLATLPVVAEAMAAIPAGRSAGYAPIAGSPAFLEAVVDDLFGVGTDVASAAVAVGTPGATGALHHALANFLEPGQSVLVPSMFWGPYRVIAEHSGRCLATFPMFDADLTPDFGALETGLRDTLARQGRALVLLNFPCNNPTGYSLDAREWDAVAGILADAGRRGPVSVMIDWAYGRFGSPGANGWRDHLQGLLEATTVLVAWTMSKTFAQYGARVGALVALHRDPDERSRISNALSYSCRATWSNCNHLGQLAGAELLSDPGLRRRGDAERRALLDLLKTRAARFEELAAAAGLVHPRYEGGFFVSVFCEDGERVAAAMRELGVFVVPAERSVRVAICATPAAEMGRLVEALSHGVVAAASGPAGGGS